MARYGNFEAVREVYTTHGLTVYAARKAGTQDDTDFAIKVFTPDLGMMVEAEASGGSSTALAEFEARSRNRLEVQQKAAAASAYIAPVIESGVADNEAWYVTKFYPRSVNRLVVGHVNLGQDGVHHVISATAKGAHDIQRITGRSHGAILPTNIQIGKSEKIRDLEVVLSDPADGGPADAVRLEKADLRAIGEVLYQLVRRRPLEDGAQWLILPIAMSPEWTEMFGRAADAWLKLCNRLLDPATSLSELNLEKLLGELAALTPKPAVSKPMLIGAAAALVFVLVGAFLGYNKLNKGTLVVTVDPPEAIIRAKFSSGIPDVEGRGRIEAGAAKGTRVTLTATYPGLTEATKAVTLEGGTTLSEILVIPHGVIRIEARDAGNPIEARIVSTTVTNKSPFIFYTGRDGPAADFTVYREGYLPVDIKTSGRIGQTTNILVNLTRVAPDKKTVAVVLESNPFGAEVMLDGQTNSLPHRQWLIAGETYTAVVRFQDWAPLTNTFTASESSPRIAFAFPHGYIYFQCPSCPDGVAGVYVGERKITDTPKSLPWPVGETEFTFRREGFDDAARKISIKDGERPTLSISLNATVGFVQLETQPPAAVILDANDKPLGEIEPGKPTLKLTLKPGSYTFKARHKDFGNAGPTNVTVVKGQTKPVLLRFDYSELTLSSDPAGGEFLDPSTKQWQPMAGMARLLLKPGANSLKARHPKLAEQDVSLDLVKWTLKEHRVDFPYASLVVTSLPPDATIVINGAETKLPAGGWFEPIVRLAPVDFTLRYATNGQVMNGVVRFDPRQRGAYTNGYNFIRREWRNSIGMEFVWFPKTRVGSKEEGGYWVGKHEVTREQFKSITGLTPSRLTANDGGRANLPVDAINAQEARDFCAKLTEKDRAANKLPSTEEGEGRGSYSLPSEEEWAYFASRATIANAVTSYGMPAGQKRQGPEPVGSTGQPDGFGLYDVKGNLWELCTSSQAGSPFVQIGGRFTSTTPGSLEGKPPFGRTPVVNDTDPNLETGFRVVFRPGQ